MGGVNTGRYRRSSGNSLVRFMNLGGWCIASELGVLGKSIELVDIAVDVDGTKENPPECIIQSLILVLRAFHNFFPLPYPSAFRTQLNPQAIPPADNWHVSLLFYVLVSKPTSQYKPSENIRLSLKHFSDAACIEIFLSSRANALCA